MSRRYRTHALLVAALSVCSPAQTPAQSAFVPLQQKLAAIDKLVDAKRQELHIAGVGLAIVQDDQVIFQKGYGLRYVDQKLPVTPDTLFGIASSTKAFTALAAVMAADEGKLSLDDSPKKYLPYFKLRDPDGDAQVTLRDLLSNRTGLNMANLPLQYSGILTRAETIQLMSDVKPTARLRARWQYQNIMFAAAGEVVAAAEGTTWEKDILKRVLEPLGMKASRVSLQDLRAARDHTPGYEYDKESNTWKPATLMDLSSTAPDGAILSTVRDMTRWLRFMLAGGQIDGKRLVSEKGYADLIHQEVTIAPGIGYALGWFLKQRQGHRIIEHGGNIPGFSAEVSMMPDQKLGVVLLMNTYYSPLGEIVKEAVWSNLVDTPSTAVTAGTETAGTPVQADHPEREVGSYKPAQATVETKITLEKQTLTIALPGNPKLTLEPQGGRRYKIAPPAPSGLFVTFRDNSDGKTELFLETPQGKEAMLKAGPYVVWTPFLRQPK